MLPPLLTPIPVLDHWPEVDHWSAAFELWLQSSRTLNTRRAYAAAWQSLSRFTHKRPPQITRSDLAAWVESMRAEASPGDAPHGRGRAGSSSPCTIALRLAAISSFYTYTMRVYTFTDSSGQERPLHSLNPASAIPRPRRSPYQRAAYLSPEQAKAFLRAIPRLTPQGKRDYALFLAYLVTGRRNTEIRSLRWGDMEPELHSSPFKPRNLARQPQNVQVWYRWRGKGRTRRDECALPVWHAILDYLQSAGRLASIQPTDFIFTSLTNNASHLPSPLLGRPVPRNEGRGACPGEAGRDEGSPLSARMVGKLVKKYARRAGLDPLRITVHTLRHTAAMLRKEAGDDLESISAFLGHSSLAVTQLYLHQIEGRPDIGWQRVAFLLGLPCQSQDLADSAP